MMDLQVLLLNCIDSTGNDPPESADFDAHENTADGISRTWERRHARENYNNKNRQILSGRLNIRVLNAHERKQTKTRNKDNEQLLSR